MKIVIIQKNINNKDYLQFLEDVALLKPDLVLFGELAQSGCLYNGGEGIELEKLNSEFETFPFAVGLGFPHLLGNKLFNSYAIFHNGDIFSYNKIKLFEPMNELETYEPGDKIGYMDTPLGKIGVTICYDIRFPELFDQLKDAGAEMILIPAAFPRVRIGAWRSLLVERAKQTGLTVIGINSVGDDGTNEFGGSSMVIAPDGRIIAQSDEINETIIEVEL